MGPIGNVDPISDSHIWHAAREADSSEQSGYVRGGQQGCAQGARPGRWRPRMPFVPGKWPQHPNEAQRMKLLNGFEVLDTEFERQFDRITELVKKSFKPVSFK